MIHFDGESGRLLSNLEAMGEDMTKLEETRELFDSILCLCVEGRECVARRDLLNAIQKRAEKGCEIAKTDVPDNGHSSENQTKTG